MGILSDLNPWDVVKELTRSHDVLKVLPEDHDFWTGAILLLDPYAELPYQFSLVDPKGYGKGVNSEVFHKILSAIRTRSLSESQAAVALSRFSVSCTEEQWLGWYKHLLSNEFPVPIDIDLYNASAPVTCRVSPLRQRRVNRLVKGSMIPKAFFVEPVYTGITVLWFLLKNRPIKGYLTNGERFVNDTIIEELEILRQSDRFNENLVLETVYENPELTYLRDIVTYDQFREHQVTQPLGIRLAFLDNIFYSILEQETECLEIAQVEMCNSYESSIPLVDRILEQGFESVYLRDMAEPYWGYTNKTCDLQVQHKGSVTLKLTELKTYPDGSKYPGVIDALIGQKKDGTVVTVRMGMSFSQRKNWLDVPLGKEFTISFCGLVVNGDLMYPRFHEWSQ